MAHQPEMNRLPGDFVHATIIAGGSHGDIPKQAVAYTNADKTGRYQCRSCGMFIDDKERCTIHPADQVIRDEGSCVYWIGGPNATGEEPHGGVTAEISGYEENDPGFGCSRCAHFLADEESCTKIDKDSEGVDPGKILPGSCCNYWTRGDGEEEDYEEGGENEGYDYA